MPQEVPEFDGPQAEPARRGRAAPSRCAARAVVVEHHGAVTDPRDGREAHAKLARLLGRQAAREDSALRLTEDEIPDADSGG